ncbi:hypothetical protein J45TS6_45170 [Paenibacillus sp. J45TS6]|uniref:hypothetical protein n=1 Tax=Paenibacillus sp. J45TS6 TaxID=2807196 RepID=UPI001B17F11E|nr:hypothetical protein [Paenibacillus sp. J45TS6]GIP46058.1 hypothetical protein J45TS6_45170 [Paenibacillus sp. J45TS6]
MKVYVSEGFKSMREHYFVVLFLFIYQLVWGMFLYKIVSSAVVPLLMRYPDPPPHELSKVLFWMEGQLSLSVSPLVHQYAWLLFLMFLIRMLMTPLIRAGLLHSLHEQGNTAKGLAFFQGIKQHWKKTSLFYFIEVILLLIPAYWIVPVILPNLITAIYNLSVLTKVIPYLLLWMIYGYAIKQLLLYCQIGLIGKRSGSVSIWICIRYAVPVALVSLLLGFITLAIFGSFTAVSFIWTGLLALILQQSYHLIRSIMNVWKISAHFSLWYSKSSSDNS